MSSQDSVGADTPGAARPVRQILTRLPDPDEDQNPAQQPAVHANGGFTVGLDGAQEPVVWGTNIRVWPWPDSASASGTGSGAA